MQPTRAVSWGRPGSSLCRRRWGFGDPHVGTGASKARPFSGKATLEFAVPKGKGCCPPRPSWPGAEEPGWGALGRPPGHFGICPLAKLLSQCPVLACGVRDRSGMCVLPQVALGCGRRFCPSLGPPSKAVGCGFLRRDACGKGMASCGTCGTSASEHHVDALRSCCPISESAPLSHSSLFQLGDHHQDSQVSGSCVS